MHSLSEVIFACALAGCAVSVLGVVRWAACRGRFRKVLSGEVAEAAFFAAGVLLFFLVATTAPWLWAEG